MVINVIWIMVNNVLIIGDILIVGRNRITNNKNMLSVTSLTHLRRMLPTHPQCLSRKKLVHLLKCWLLQKNVPTTTAVERKKSLSRDRLLVCLRSTKAVHHIGIHTIHIIIDAKGIEHLGLFAKGQVKINFTLFVCFCVCLFIILTEGSHAP